MGEFARLEVGSGEHAGVGTIRLDRPKMNALNEQVQEEIRAAAHEATERDDVKAVVVYGGEKVFAAGADIKEMADMQYVDMVRRSGALQSSFSAVARIPKPVIAAVTVEQAHPDGGRVGRRDGEVRGVRTPRGAEVLVPSGPHAEGLVACAPRPALRNHSTHCVARVPGTIAIPEEWERTWASSCVSRWPTASARSAWTGRR